MQGPDTREETEGRTEHGPGQCPVEEEAGDLAPGGGAQGPKDQGGLRHLPEDGPKSEEGVEDVL